MPQRMIPSGTFGSRYSRSRRVTARALLWRATVTAPTCCRRHAQARQSPRHTGAPSANAREARSRRPGALVDELRPPAGGTSSAANDTRRHDQRPPPPRAAMGQVRVLRLITCSRQPPTPRAAVALVLRDRHVRAPAAVAVSLPEGANHTTSQPRRPTNPADPAQLLIAVADSKRPRTAFAAPITVDRCCRF
jgi:hypothetical protein